MSATPNPEIKPDKTGLFVAIATSLAVLAVLMGYVKYSLGYGGSYYTIFRALNVFWSGFEDWQHGKMVPFIVAGLLYWQRGRLAKIPLAGENWALFPLICSFGLYWMGFKMDVVYVGYASIMLMLASLTIWIAGWPFFKAVMFPWAFLTFTWPLLFLDNYIAFPLRLVLSEFSFHFLNLVGLHAIKVGTAVVSAADFQNGIAQGAKFSVDIANPCSGMRSLFALLMVGCLYAHLTLRTPLQKWILVLLSIPLAVLGNFVRIMMLVSGTLSFGSAFAIGEIDHPSAYHLGAGFAVFGVAILGMVALGSLLKRLPPSIANLLGKGPVDTDSPITK